MAAVTPQLIKELRELTGAGMMDCKNALNETGGDLDKAVQALREAGLGKAAKKAGNVAAEGLIAVLVNSDNTKATMLELNSQTDFVAKNETYHNFVQSLMDIAMNNLPASAEELKALKYDDKLTVEEKITEQVGVIGEKLDLSAYALLKGEAVVAYNHPGNQLATMIVLNVATENALEAGRQVAMQVAAMNPIALNKDGVDPRTIEREIEVGKDLAIQEGKPAEMAEKIAQGRLAKFFKENTLLSQEFIRDNKMTVEDFLKSTENGLTVSEFKRFSLS